jgi:hypothetical protein
MLSKIWVWIPRCGIQRIRKKPYTVPWFIVSTLQCGDTVLCVVLELSSVGRYFVGGIFLPVQVR